MKYYDALLLAEVQYEGPLKELNNFGVYTETCLDQPDVNMDWSWKAWQTYANLSMITTRI